MKAGLLREILEFREEVKSQDLNGFVSNRYETVLTCKASRRKMSAVADKSGVNAMEQFIGSIIVFQVRNYPAIKENQRVVYRGVEYAIRMIDPQRDNTLVITIEKLNT